MRNETRGAVQRESVGAALGISPKLIAQLLLVLGAGVVVVVLGVSVFPLQSAHTAIAAGALSLVVLLVRRVQAARWARISAEFAQASTTWSRADRVALAVAVLGALVLGGLALYRTLVCGPGVWEPLCK